MGISAGKIIVGEAVIAERAPPPVEPPKEVVKQLRDISNKLKVGNLINLSETTAEAGNGRKLSSYFVVNKESDYLDHNIRNNRR